MKDGFKVIDADRHVLEPTDLFAKYLPEKFRSRVEIKGPNQSFRLVDGEKISDADKLRNATQQENLGSGVRLWLFAYVGYLVRVASGVVAGYLSNFEEQRR